MTSLNLNIRETDCKNLKMATSSFAVVDAEPHDSIARESVQAGGF
jgi:hypothetical protein